jgi:hypothetical protein
VRCIAGLIFGAVDVVLILPIVVPDKRTALTAAISQPICVASPAEAVCADRYKFLSAQLPTRSSAFSIFSIELATLNRK